MNIDSSLLFLGDVIPYKQFRFRNDLKTVINLECPLTRGNKPVSGKVNLSVPDNHLSGIFGENLYAINLANNHILDYGIDGFYSTIEDLKSKDFSFFGVNLPGNNNHNPYVSDLNGMRIAFLSAVSEKTSPVIEFDDFNYITLLESEEFECRLQGLKNNADRIIIYIHWGTVDSSYPDRNQVLTARRLIDSGADIVIGSHAHAPQPVEKYKDGIIAYNLGNFIMPDFTNTPSFYDEEGKPLSTLTRKLMVWNRISWGLEVDLQSMDYRVRKFAFIADRIVEFRRTIFDRYLELPGRIMDDNYATLLNRHLNRRKLRRKVGELIR